MKSEMLSMNDRGPVSGSGSSIEPTGRIPQRVRSRLAQWALGLLLLTSASAHANPIWCTGTISHLWVDSGGIVQVLSSWRQDHTAICSITNTWNAIPADLCRSWYALLLTARASGQRITTMYFHNSTCSTLPTYNSTPAPSYVMLMD